MTTSMAKRPRCDLEHDRATPARIRIRVKSTRLGRAGHPVMRELALCAWHARKLRDFGLDIIGP